MVNPIKKLFIVFICLALVACARSPKVIDAESLSFSIAEDISELEVDASLKILICTLQLQLLLETIVI